jgi:hypothetical protein
MTLKGYWTFDETATLLDKSGNNNNGTVYGALRTYGRPGFGYALSFDGIDDYVDVPDSPSLRFDTSNAITIALWINLNIPLEQQGTPTNPYIFPLGKMINGNQREFYILFDRNTKLCIAGFTVAGMHYSVISSAVILPYTWYHIVYTYDKNLPINNMNLYINGLLTGTSTHSASIPVYNTNLNIGRADGELNWTGNINATIDSIKIYDNGFTSQDVINDMNECLTNPSVSIEIQ